MNIVKTLLSSLLLCVCLISCTITPSIKEGNSASVGESGKLDSGITEIIIGQGAIVDATTRDRYNKLIEMYPLGVESYKFDVTLTKDYGVTEVKTSDGTKKYFFNKVALKYLRVLNLARINGLAPYSGK